MCQVSWFDVARYCNWLHNGAREESSMENGAYNLNGTNERVVGKNNNAKYWVPTENEWYKAAYYDPEKNKAFGGGGGYYSFATRSSAISTDIATYARRSNIYTQNIPYTGTTLVGTYANYPSYYGTFDQTGNVGEWTDGEILLLGQTQKVERGGWWTNEYENVQSKLGRFGYDPSTRNGYFGIRLARRSVTSADIERNWNYSDNGSTVTITSYKGVSDKIEIPSLINMKSVEVVGNGLSSIGISSSGSTKYVSIPSSVKTIHANAFAGANIEAIAIPDSVTSIGECAFSGCIQLKQVTMSSNLNKLGGGAFSGCGNLSNINIPPLLSALENSVFEGTGLISITIPDNIQSIGLLAFDQCLSLEKVNIGSGVASIGNAAFRGCINLKTIVIGQNVNIIGEGIVYNCSNLDAVYFLGNAPLSPAYQTGYPETTKVYYNPAKTGWNNQFVNAYIGGRSILPFLPKIKSQGISVDQETKKYSISFNTVYGVKYDIEASSDLASWRTIQTINGDGNENTFLTDMTDKAFFRISQQ